MLSVLCFVLYAVLVAGVVAALIGFTRKPMLALFRANAHMAPGARFYVRAFTLVIVLGAVSAVAAYHGPCAEQARDLTAWDCLWRAFDQLQHVLLVACLFLLGYVFLLTLLFAVLGRYRDE